MLRNMNPFSIVRIALFAAFTVFLILHQHLASSTTAFAILVYLGLFFGVVATNGFDLYSNEDSVVHSEQSTRIMKELEMAKRVQEGLLAVETPALDQIRIVKKCIPADSVGGDFYTFVDKEFDSLSQQRPSIPGVIQYVDKRESYLGIIVGDVAGHGVSSALVMALSSGLLGEIGRVHRSPGAVLSEANNHILNYIQNSQIAYVTAFYAMINLDNKRLIFSKAGHPAAILLHPDRSHELLEADGVFLGMFENETFEEKEVQLNSGDRIVLYTDGITETRNRAGELFGMDRLLGLLRKSGAFTIEQVLKFILEELDVFAEGLSPADDQTLVIVEVV